MSGRRALARKLVAELGVLGHAVPTDPISALEAMLAEANGNVEALRSLVQGLGVDGEGTDTIVSRYGSHPLVELYGQERDRLAKLARDCAAIGLEERKVRVAERESRAVLAVLGRVFDALELSDGQREVAREAAASELRSIAGADPRVLRSAYLPAEAAS